MKCECCGLKVGQTGTAVYRDEGCATDFIAYEIGLHLLTTYTDDGVAVVKAILCNHCGATFQEGDQNKCTHRSNA